MSKKEKVFFLFFFLFGKGRIFEEILFAFHSCLWLVIDYEMNPPILIGSRSAIRLDCISSRFTVEFPTQLHSSIIISILGQPSLAAYIISLSLFLFPFLLLPFPSFPVLPLLSPRSPAIRLHSHPPPPLIAKNSPPFQIAWKNHRPTPTVLDSCVLPSPPPPRLGEPSSPPRPSSPPAQADPESGSVVCGVFSHRIRPKPPSSRASRTIPRVKRRKPPCHPARPASVRVAPTSMRIPTAWYQASDHGWCGAWAVSHDGRCWAFSTCLADPASWSPLRSCGGGEKSAAGPHHREKNWHETRDEDATGAAWSAGCRNDSSPTAGSSCCCRHKRMNGCSRHRRKRAVIWGGIECSEGSTLSSAAVMDPPGHRRPCRGWLLVPMLLARYCLLPRSGGFVRISRVPCAKTAAAGGPHH